MLQDQNATTVKKMTDVLGNTLSHLVEFSPETVKWVKQKTFDDKIESDFNAKEFYIYIPEGKFGRIEGGKSPQGIRLCTNKFSTCNIVALISKDKKRYVLIHVDISLNIDKIIPEQKSWVGEEASFFIYRRNNENYKLKSQKLAAKLTDHKPTKIIVVKDDIDCIVLKLGDSEPCLQPNLPGNTLFHEKQALIYSQHNIENFNTETPNYLNPLIFDVSKWSTYNSFDLSASNISYFQNCGFFLERFKISDIFYIKIFDHENTGGEKTFYACVLCYQFLITQNPKDTDKESFLFDNLETHRRHIIEHRYSDAGDYDAKNITQLILKKRKEFSELEFSEFYKAILAEVSIQYPENFWLSFALAVILQAYHGIFDCFSSSMSEEVKQDLSKALNDDNSINGFLASTFDQLSVSSVYYSQSKEIIFSFFNIIFPNNLTNLVYSYLHVNILNLMAYHQDNSTDHEKKHNILKIFCSEKGYCSQRINAFKNSLLAAALISENSHLWNSLLADKPYAFNDENSLDLLTPFNLTRKIFDDFNYCGQFPGSEKFQSLIKNISFSNLFDMISKFNQVLSPMLIFQISNYQHELTLDFSDSDIPELLEMLKTIISLYNQIQNGEPIAYPVLFSIGTESYMGALYFNNHFFILDDHYHAINSLSKMCHTIHEALTSITALKNLCTDILDNVNRKFSKMLQFKIDNNKKWDLNYQDESFTEKSLKNLKILFHSWLIIMNNHSLNIIVNNDSIFIFRIAVHLFSLLETYHPKGNDLIKDHINLSKNLCQFNLFTSALENKDIRYNVAFVSFDLNIQGSLIKK